jgi:hypothetical protein
VVLVPYRLPNYQHTAQTATVTVSPLRGSRRAAVLAVRRVAAKRPERPERGRAVPQGARA